MFTPISCPCNVLNISGLFSLIEPEWLIGVLQCCGELGSFDRKCIVDAAAVALARVHLIGIENFSPCVSPLAVVA